MTEALAWVVAAIFVAVIIIRPTMRDRRPWWRNRD